jgi:hypothetical protein
MPNSFLLLCFSIGAIRQSLPQAKGVEADALVSESLKGRRGSINFTRRVANPVLHNLESWNKRILLVTHSVSLQALHRS